MRTLLTLSALLCFTQDKEKACTDPFLVDEQDLSSAGRNPYFSLEPGYPRIYETADKKETLTVTVLEETKVVAGIETRVVEGRETVDGKFENVLKTLETTPL